MHRHDIVLFGPPGVGKGAQAELLSHSYGLVHLSTGEIIRAEIAAGSELGRRVENAVARGEFADDATVIEIVVARLDLPEFRDGFVMDGFPRTIAQAERLEQLLAERSRKIDHALFIEAPETTIIARLSGRLVCRNCKKTYHRQFKRPRIEGVCDHCKSRVVNRHDDSPEVHRERLRAYAEMTAPLADFYRERDCLRKINGDQTIDEVALEIRRTIKAGTAKS